MEVEKDLPSLMIGKVSKSRCLMAAGTDTVQQKGMKRSAVNSQNVRQAGDRMGETKLS